LTIGAGATGDFSATLDTPGGYMPVGVTAITTGQVKWTLVQFEINVENNYLVASIHSVDTSSRTSTVAMSVAFIKVS
jgi:hypothetical protein